MLQELRRRMSAMCGWDRPLLTFTYPGFDSGSPEKATSPSPPSAPSAPSPPALLSPSHSCSFLLHVWPAQDGFAVCFKTEEANSKTNKVYIGFGSIIAALDSMCGACKIRLPVLANLETCRMLALWIAESSGWGMPGNQSLLV